MTDYILHVMLSNLLIALALAILALVLQRRYHANALANIVWVVILLKLLTPPLVSIPLLELEPLVKSAPSVFADPVAGEEIAIADMINYSANDLNAKYAMRVERRFVGSGGIVSSQVVVSFATVWIGITALLLLVSLFRIIRFHIHIHRQSKTVEPKVQRSGHQLAKILGLRRTPRIVVLPANISPFVWWLGGKPQIFLSQVAIEQLQPSELRMVLAHEMVHIKRFDHYVRWLEWFSAAVLWWNPVMWVARQQLRATEEIACDQTVIRLAGIAKFDYANSLLKMAEILAKSTNRPPTVASEFNSGGVLERRLDMIISNEQLGISQGMRMLTIVLAVCIFPVGLVYAQDYGAVQRRLIEAVKAGELSREQVAPMMEAMKRMPKSEQSKEATSRERYATGAKQIEAAIKSGRISKEDGEKRLAAMREQMFPTSDNGDAKSDRVDVDDMEQRKSRYMASAKRIEAAIKSGKISKVEGKNLLAEMRKQMAPARDKGDAKSDRAEGSDMEVRRRRYMAAAEEIEMAVEAGTMSKEDAEKTLIQMRKEMFPARDKGDAKSDRVEGGDMEALKRRYMGAAEEIERAVEAGKMSKQEAEKTLIEMRKEMFPERKKRGSESGRSEGGDMEALKRRYMKGAEKIEAAVEAGKMSKKDAEQKLIGMRKKMFPERDKEASKSDRSKGSDMQALKERYDAVVKEYEAAIKSGEMSKKDAKKKMSELREKMFGK